MPFKFKQASCVVVGTFNIYVIQPRLLMELKILSDDVQVVTFETKLIEPGLRFTADGLGAKWTVRPDRLIVEADTPEKDCGADVATVLEALQWTPLTGIGCNATFSQSPIEMQGGKIQFPDIEAPPGCNLKQRSIHIGIEKDELLFNIQVCETKDNLDLSINIHCPLKDQKTQAETSRAAQKGARRYLQNLSEGMSLMTQLFGVKFDG